MGSSKTVLEPINIMRYFISRFIYLFAYLLRLRYLVASASMTIDLVLLLALASKIIDFGL